ncbi:MAG TPA: hypothetical protein VLT33_24415, partial [Labilithrix sp.]|nr:hypothetical protein [Labilithrix sp.]
MPTIALTRTMNGAPAAWTVDDAEAKLQWRAALPGASTYDRAASTLRALQASGADAFDLLPLALPASWMVNAKASSRAMQRWLSPGREDAWRVLLEAIGADLSPEDWLALPAADRAGCTHAVQALASGNDGESLAAVTKVLALLRPQIVPLMDDAALWFALELVPEPDTAERPSAPPSAFVPMLDWFAEQVISGEQPLIALASRHELATLDAAQTLDRLLW